MVKKVKTIGIVYTVTHKETGTVYVGATTKSIDERKKDHLHKASKGTGHHFHNAIATLGPDAFQWEQVDTAQDVNELARKECEYVERFDSFHSGFNSDAGGGIKKSVYQYSIKDGSLLNKYECLEDAANAVNAYKTCVGNACTGHNKTCKGYYWSYSSSFPLNLKDERRKTVIQLHLDGSILAEYKSVAEASRQTGISKTCISRVCRKERESSGGYLWTYSD
jgi:hypothetical protein